MNKEKAIPALEFLIAFFSTPDKSLFEMIYAGNTPLGKIKISDPFEEFYQNISEEITDLFINSPKQRPLYPLASEYLKDQDAKESLIYALNEVYLESGKAVNSYPPDHLIVVYEFILDALYNGDDSRAAAFYSDHVKDWTKQFAKVILDRKPNKCICHIVNLFKQLDSHLEQESMIDERHCRK